MDRVCWSLGTGRQGPVNWGEMISLMAGLGAARGAVGREAEEEWSPVGEGLRTWSLRRTAAGISP